MSISLSGNLCGSSLVPMMRSGPAPTLAATAAFGLVLGAAGHAYGWPFAHGGSQRLSDALAGLLRAKGATLATGQRVSSMDQVTDGRAVLFDLTPRQVLPIARGQWPGGFRPR